MYQGALEVGHLRTAPELALCLHQREGPCDSHQWYIQIILVDDCAKQRLVTKWD